MATFKYLVLVLVLAATLQVLLALPGRRRIAVRKNNGYRPAARGNNGYRPAAGRSDNRDRGMRNGRDWPDRSGGRRAPAPSNNGYNSNGFRTVRNNGYNGNSNGYSNNGFSNNGFSNNGYSNNGYGSNGYRNSQGYRSSNSGFRANPYAAMAMFGSTDRSEMLAYGNTCGPLKNAGQLGMCQCCPQHVQCSLDQVQMVYDECDGAGLVACCTD